MKFNTYLFLLVLIIIPFQSAFAKGIAKNTVILTPEEVDSADDIEAAIINATSSGTHPGTVILNGKDGNFIFTGDDRSLNIFVSSLTLLGKNQAVIENCDDGLFFDDFPLQHILIDGITFLCTGDGMEATGTFQDVTLRNNIFWVGNNGIGIGGHSSGWLITRNYIQAGMDGIWMTSAENIVLTNNYITGNNGIVLRGCTQLMIQRNIIQATYLGVQLTLESWKNKVQGNSILGVGLAGIGLEPGVTHNSILVNRVICSAYTACLTVDAVPGVSDSNKIVGNKP